MSIDRRSGKRAFQSNMSYHPTCAITQMFNTSTEPASLDPRIRELADEFDGQLGRAEVGFARRSSQWLWLSVQQPAGSCPGAFCETILPIAVGSAASWAAPK